MRELSNVSPNRSTVSSSGNATPSANSDSLTLGFRDKTKALHFSGFKIILLLRMICKNVYYYSYFEEFSVLNSDNNIVTKEQRRVYYDFAPDLQYFQVSNKTLFETHLRRLKFVGYDRACDLHSFLSNLSKKGNLDARILLDHVKFLVDMFHVIKHKEECYMPLNNPNCRYHPHLEVFREIRGTNTECAEQSNRFLNKHVCNGMAEFKFKAFLWFVIETRNELIEERL